MLCSVDGELMENITSNKAMEFPPTSLMPLNRYHCCCSLTKLCLTLCDSMDRSTPGSSVLHYPREFAQIHVH